MLLRDGPNSFQQLGTAAPRREASRAPNLHGILRQEVVPRRTRIGEGGHAIDDVPSGHLPLQPIQVERKTRRAPWHVR